MASPQPKSSRVLSPASGDFVKDVANSNVKEEPDQSQPRAPGATEPPLPLTPARLELIKAYAASRNRGADDAAASRIAKRFAPRGPVAPPSGQVRVTPLARPASPLVAWASGIRTLTAVLVIAALLPNLVLAVFWFRLIDPPWSETALPPKDSAQLKAEPEIPSPVLSAPDMLEALEGATVALPIALDGTDGVPKRSVIVIKGLPHGSTLSAGYALSETEWKLNPDEIGDLHVALGAAESGDSKLSVELVAPDNRIVATTFITLSTRAAAQTELVPDGFEQALVPDIEAAELEAGTQSEVTQEDTAANTASLDAMPLPDRRPEPPAIDDANASWIKPTAWVNLRDGPSSTAKVLSIVPKGVKLRVLGRKRSWVQVKNPSTAESGWIYARNVASVR